jgi:hypothetical protein
MQLEALISESDLFQREASTKLRGAAQQESLSTGTAGQARGNTARYRKDSVDADSMRCEPSDIPVGLDQRCV